MGSHKSVTREDAHPPGAVSDYLDFDEVAAPATPASGDVRVYAKSDGKLYIKDDAGTETDLTSGGGGGGKSYVTHPGLRPPDSAHANDIEFSAYANATSPTGTPGMTWGNQGLATGVIQNGALVLNTNGSTTNSWRGVGRTAPTGDFTVDVAVAAHLFGNYHGIGVFFLWGTPASPTDTIEGVRLSWNGGIRVTHHYANTSYVGTGDRATFAGGANVGHAFPDWTHLKLDWTSSSEVIQPSISHSGIAGTWLNVGSGYTATSYADPDYVMIMVEKNGQEVVGLCRHLRFDWTPDFDPTTDD